MTCDEMLDFAPLKNCGLQQLCTLYPKIAVGRQGGRVFLAISLELDDNMAIILTECNGTFHEYKKYPQKKPISLDGLYRLIRHLNH